MGLKMRPAPLTDGLTAILLALPWLNPLTYGPTHAVPQALAVWLCAALCGLIWERAQVPAVGRIRVAAAAWLLAAAASAGMGLVQYLGHAAPFSPWINFVEAGQAYANLRQRNQLATLLSIGLCALLWWQVQAPGMAGRARFLGPALLALGAALLAAADAASGSRTGFFQLLLLLALALLWRRGQVTLALAWLAYALAAWGLPRLAGMDPLHSGILGRMGEVAPACASRLTLWSNVLQLIAQKPWTGWGWAELDYAHFITLYQGPRFCEILGNAHNLPLHLAVELGVPFALLVCGALLWGLLRAQPWRESDTTRQLAWRVLAVIGLHSLLEYPLWYAPFQLAAGLALWLLWQTGQDRAPRWMERSAPVAAGHRRARAPLLLACALLLTGSYIAWDYWRISQIYLSAAQRDAAYREDTLDKIRPSWLFADQVLFAELGVTVLTPDNAEHVHALALQLLHFSPEASVVSKLIASAKLLGREDEVRYYRLRFAAAYPQEYADWNVGQESALGDKTP